MRPFLHDHPVLQHHDPVRVLDGGQAVRGDREALTREAADVLYHLLVMCAARGVSLADVEAELERREGVSGVAEKAGRTST